MSCNRNGQRVSDAARRNGIMGQVSSYLNTIGSWAAYRDLSDFEEIPGRVAQITETFFGLKGLIRGNPRLAGMMGVILGMHAAEQVTGAIGTMGMRTLKRGKPFGQYRGIILRENPSVAKVGRLLNRASGGRVQQADGFYFFESGRTWQASTVETQVGDTARTLTQLRSFSIPNREFFFDRRIEPQQLVDVALGDRDPDTIPGFLGSTNELENTVTPLGNLKRAFFLTNWLLVDPSERDGGGPDTVDYDALMRGTKPGEGSTGYYSVSRPPPSAGGGYATRIWPSSSTYSRWDRPATDRAQPSPVSKSVYGSYATGNQADPKDTAARVNIEGKDRPVVVKRLVTSPITNQRKADALYYDDDLRQWREVVDDEVRKRLAKAVDDGTLPVTPTEQWPKT